MTSPSSFRAQQPYLSPDISALARALRESLTARLKESPDKPLSHLEMLNHLARATGARNYQSWRVNQQAATEKAREPLTPMQERVLRTFDERGVLQRYPVQRAVQKLAVWPLWARFEKRRVYSEPEVNEILKAANGFNDHVTLRRELVNEGLLTRERDGSQYRRVDCVPPAEALPILRAIARMVEKPR